MGEHGMNRKRIEKLRDFLRDEVTDKRFNIAYMVTGPDGRYVKGDGTVRQQLKECGTAACVAGWANYLFAPRTKGHGVGHAAARLGLRPEQERALFTPWGFYRHPELFTRARAVATLTRLLETGKVDWGEP